MMRGLGLVGIVGLAVGCGGSGPSADGDTGGDASSTQGSATAPTSGITSTGSEGETSGVDTGTTGDDASTQTTMGGDGPKLDIVVPDVGDEDPPEMPTCDTLEDFGPTSMGCEFWAIDVPVSAGFGAGGLGVGVGNPWELDVTVTFEDMRGPGNTLRQIGQINLGPKESTIVPVNGPGGLLDGEDHTVGVGLVPAAAFRVTSDQPITAMQINPVGGAASFVPDASMLLPTNALDGSHFAAGYGGTFTGFVIAVATEDATMVTTTSGDVMLDAFDAHVWQPMDSTGFFVGANAPIAVFSGTSCTNVPAGTSWCDHIEEQVIPLSAWGTAYIGARHPARMPDQNAQPEDVVWRVIAAQDATTVTLTPPVAGGQVQLSNAGDYVEFATNESFLAESDPNTPFMLVQYMAGGTSVGTCAGPADGIPVGDPYMMQMVPIDQWLTQLPFLTDTSYIRDFVFIARETGSVVDLECLGPIPDDHFTAIAGTSYEVGWVDLDSPMGGEGNCVDGQHFIVADAPVGVHVGGIDCAASYGYPGGLSLDALWTPPDEPPG